jgi:hypothetical protein
VKENGKGKPRRKKKKRMMMMMMMNELQRENKRQRN